MAGMPPVLVVLWRSNGYMSLYHMIQISTHKSTHLGVNAHIVSSNTKICEVNKWSFHISIYDVTYPLNFHQSSMSFTLSSSVISGTSYLIPFHRHYFLYFTILLAWDSPFFLFFADISDHSCLPWLLCTVAVIIKALTRTYSLLEPTLIDH